LCHRCVKAPAGTARIRDAFLGALNRYAPFPAPSAEKAAGATAIAHRTSTGRRKIVATGNADLVALTRGMLYDPRWSRRAAAELGGQVAAPPPHGRAPAAGWSMCSGNTSFGGR